MRLVSGVVCVGVTEDPRLSVIYGPGIHAGWTHESIETNGFSVWRDRRTATAAQRELARRPGIRATALYRLTMRIAETTGDLSALQGRRALVVIMCGENEQRLFGSMVPGCIRICDRLASLFENGFRTFSKFAEADDAAREMSRQVMTKVTLAAFSLQRL